MLYDAVVSETDVCVYTTQHVRGKYINKMTIADEQKIYAPPHRKKEENHLLYAGSVR